MNEFAADQDANTATPVDPGLSEQEKSELIKLAQGWLDSGKDTSRADRPAVEAALNAAYKAAGLKPPKNIYWVDSPSKAMLTVAVHKAVRAKYETQSAAVTRRIQGMLDIRLLTPPVTKSNIDPYRAQSAHCTLLEYFKLTPQIYRAVDGWAASRVTPHDPRSQGCSCQVCQTIEAYKALNHPYTDENPSRYTWDNLDELLAASANFVQQVFFNNVELAVVNELIELRKDLSIRVAATKSEPSISIPGSLGALAPHLIKALNSMLNSRWGVPGWGAPAMYGSLDSLKSARPWVEVAPFILKSAPTRTPGARAKARQEAALQGIYPLASLSSLYFATLTDFAVISERPTSVKLDPQGLQHSSDGPAIEYADGFKVYVWHGTRVPESLIMSNWSVAEILKEPNTEVRRCAIEKMGWDEFVARAGMRQVGATAPDPGNPGQQLTLYDVPEIFEEGIRVLICTNATLERDGTRRKFGLTVPRSVKTPVAAAAWSFGVPVKQYQGLLRAC